VSVVGSAAWFDDLVVRAAAIELGEGCDPVVVVANCIDGAPEGTIDRWYLRLADDVAISRDPPPQPVTVEIHCDPGTAASLAAGTLNAQQAISTGRLRLRGDIAALVVAAPTLASLLAPPLEPR
jgi:hypothetical protein